MQGHNKMQRVNEPSRLLSKEENDFVFSLLGPRCVSMSTAVIQLFATMRQPNSEWIKQLAGVACFVRDSIKRSYFIRVYCMMKHDLIWEEEMYRSIEINHPLKFLITFEGQDCMVALNFANENEAKHFYDTIFSTVTSRAKKERRNKNPNNPHVEDDDIYYEPQSIVQNRPNYPGMPPPWQPQPQIQSHPQASKFSFLNKDDKKNKKKSNKESGNKRPTLTKELISAPQNMKHIAHVGLGAPMKIETLNAWNNYLEEIGIPENELRDDETRELLYDVIQNHQNHNFRSPGDNVSKTNEQFQKQHTYLNPPSIPSSSLPQHPRSRSPQHPPPPPPIMTLPSFANELQYKNTPDSINLPGNNRKNKRLPPLMAPPPPPPSISLPSDSTVRFGALAPAPPIPSVATQKCSSNSKSLVFSGPPPPPPVPMMLSNPAPAQNDARSALLSDIRDAPRLRPAMDNFENPPQSCARDDLLKHIREGIQLKPANIRNIEPTQNNRACNDPVAAALFNALEMRKTAFQNSEDEEESEDEIWSD